MSHCGLDDIMGAEDIGLHRLHREKFAAGHFLKCRSIEDVIHPGHSTIYGLSLSHVSDIVLDLIRLIAVTHIILLLLVT